MNNLVNSTAVSDVGCEYIGMYYDLETNRFIDEDGFIIWSIFDFITPNDLFLFRLGKEYMLVRHRSFTNVYCELYYPEDDL